MHYDRCIMLIKITMFEEGAEVGAYAFESEKTSIIPTVGDELQLPSEGTRKVLSRKLEYTGGMINVIVAVGPAAEDIRYTDPKVTWL